MDSCLVIRILMRRKEACLFNFKIYGIEKTKGLRGVQNMWNKRAGKQLK